MVNLRRGFTSKSRPHSPNYFFRHGTRFTTAAEALENRTALPPLSSLLLRKAKSAFFAAASIKPHLPIAVSEREISLDSEAATVDVLFELAIFTWRLSWRSGMAAAHARWFSSLPPHHFIPLIFSPTRARFYRPKAVSIYGAGHELARRVISRWLSPRSWRTLHPGSRSRGAKTSDDLFQIKVFELFSSREIYFPSRGPAVPRPA
jgi:hypothetical protein